MLSEAVHLRIRCLELKGKDLISRSDPFVVVYIKSKSPNDEIEGKYREIYRSETIQNNHNPEFVKPVEVEYRFEEVQDLKFEVYDRDGNSEDLKEHDFVGEFKTTMSKIMGARGSTVSAELGKKGSSSKRGKIVVVGSQISMVKDLVKFQFAAEKLDRKNLMGLGKSDPFYVISQIQDDGSFMKVFMSEVIKSKLSPTWNQQKIPLHILCNGDLNKKIQIEVFDHDSSGDHKLIGCFTTTFEEMKTRRGYNVVNEKKGKKSSGNFKVLELEILKRHSFLEYVAGGCELKLSVAIDFTGSNGHPSRESSLHFMPSNFAYTGEFGQVRFLNQYQKAIASVGQILQDYDLDQIIPVYGFGAEFPYALNGSTMNNHCFPITFDVANPGVHRVEGILQTYHNCIQNIQLSGPTLFSHVLTKAIADAGHATQQSQSYSVLLILTDGIINDMSETIAKLIQASNVPLSVIIVGVGKADFSNMELLDADGKLLSQNGKTAKRDIVQFVPFSKFEKQSYTALAEETLKEIPHQLEEYFGMMNIKPNPKLQPSSDVFIVAPDAMPMDGNQDTVAPISIPEVVAPSSYQ